MILNIFLYGYLPFMVVCFISAAWFQWFSYDQKASLGAAMALIVAFVPILNIWWTVMAIWDIPRETKHYLRGKKEMEKWEHWRKNL
jgi:uncharacterized membrane-anchored protein